VGAIERVLVGAIDMHCHSGPSPFPRRIDHFTAAQQASQLDMRAIVVKSHHHSTVMDVLALSPWLSRTTTTVYGGIALNNTVGGTNPAAVELALRMGGKVVWFPTISSPRHIEHHLEHAAFKFPTSAVALRPERCVDIVQPDGSLTADTEDILKLVAESGAVLSAGHLAPERILLLFDAARSLGVKRLLVNHPNFVVEASSGDVVRYAEMGAVIEHSLCMYDEESTFHQWDVDVLLDWINLVGPDRTSLCSDLGQANNPLPVEAFRKICSRLLDSGLTERELRQMVVHNPARLLGLE
jgi:Family of unknown function (DUF6282)